MSDVEAHAEEDKLYKETLSLKNEAEGLIRDTEKSLTEHSDKIPPSDKDTIESDIKSLKDALTSEQVQDIKSKLETLRISSQKIGSAVYNDQNNQEEQKSDTKKEIDAQYEDVSK